jgi:ubiquinone/menaquinone biosynthesis C-methylase UbiE
VTPDLRQRATEPERLDEGVPDDEALRSLGDLRRVNRWLGGRRAIARALRPFLRPGARLLDVGCGSADVPAWLAARSPRPALVVGLDRKWLHVRQAPASVQPVVGDVRSLPFAPLSFDVVTASLFLHHFDEDEAPEILGRLFALARGVLVVNDLHRARIPWLFARAVFPFAFESQVSVDDGLLSIRRAFRPSELRDAFRRAGIPHAEVRRSFPYRLIAMAPRNGTSP